MDLLGRGVPARGRAPRPGECCANPALAATWKRLLAEVAGAGDREARIDAAREVWRTGFIADALVRQAGRPTMDTSGERHAGTLTAADSPLVPAYETPVTYDWNGWTVCKAGPGARARSCSSKLALLPSELPRYGSADYCNLLIEGCKLAMADREAWYGRGRGAARRPAVGGYNAERRTGIGPRASHDLRPAAPAGAPPLSAHAVRRGTDEPGAGPMGVGEPHRRQEPHVPRARRTRRPRRRRHPRRHLPPGRRRPLGQHDRGTPSGGWLQSNPVVPELGFPLGTRLQMTWLEEACGHPHPRPPTRTTLTPSMALRDGVPVMAFGTPGGDQHDQWQLHFFLAVALRERVRGGLDLQGAVDAPNWHNDSFPGSFHPRGMRPGSVTSSPARTRRW
ncbi:hypothetical protein GCM10023238_08260 [Streptomyces heliomycini]